MKEKRKKIKIDFLPSHKGNFYNLTPSLILKVKKKFSPSHLFINKHIVKNHCSVLISTKPLLEIVTYVAGSNLQWSPGLEV